MQPYEKTLGITTFIEPPLVENLARQNLGKFDKKNQEHAFTPFFSQLYAHHPDNYTDPSQPPSLEDNHNVSIAFSLTALQLLKHKPQPGPATKPRRKQKDR